jgi:hemerythrin-like domain-containing protein
MSKPIKRSKNLVRLSRDHHEGLLLVWKIRQGKTYNVSPQVIAEYVVYEFNHNLTPHFADEENLLFAKAPNDELTKEAVQQHSELRQMVADLKTDSGDEKLNQFADLLEKHIRFEERQLFPHYEQTLNAEELEKIGVELEATHNVKKENTWSNEFWLKPKP